MADSGRPAPRYEYVATCPACGDQMLDVAELIVNRTVDGRPATVEVLLDALVAHMQDQHPDQVETTIRAAEAVGYVRPPVD